ncbi:MAG TPA: DNA internalization-related competence protein ComEC/Rec2 [candidate division Zixibacteria bacterium]|nr:DNA internalization-related competence protein ComEC/Rec2 [candidate division Zixibacteria bacterium]
MAAGGSGTRKLLEAIDHPSAWLAAATAGLLLGQAAACYWTVAGGLVLVPAAVPLALFVSRRARRAAALLVAGGLAFSIGYLRHRRLLDPELPAHHLRRLADEKTQLYLEGWLAREPEKLPNRQRWLFRSERLWHPTGAEETTGDVLVSVRHARREWRLGDRIRLRLRPSFPRDSGNPGGFDYATYLARREIYLIGFLEDDAAVELLAREPPPVRGFVEELRREIRRQVDRRFSPENGALLKALVIGDMGGISRGMRSDFTAAGVNHVLSISGLHVAMLGLVVFFLARLACAASTTLLLRWNLLKVASSLSLLGVVFYTALAGAMVPTVRSAFMIAVYEVAVLLDREEEVFASLALAALLSGLIWPGVIADISFQLSFLALLFIVWGMRRLEKRRTAERKEELLPQERPWLRAKLRAAGMRLAVPLLATLGTGPLVAHYFGHLSIAGFVANPIVVPLVGLVVVPLGLSIGFLFLTFPALAAPLVGVAETLLAATLRLVNFFAGLPGATLAVPSPNAAEVCGLYALILALLALGKNRRAVVFAALAAAALAADAAYWWRERWHRNELRVTYLNVGQGDAAVVEFPGSRVLVVDAGGRAFGDFDTGEAIVAPFLRARKILKVDYLLVSHPRIDHYGGMRAVVEEFNPEEFWSGQSRGRTSRFDDLEEALERRGVRRVALSEGRPCREIDRVSVCVVYSPPPGGGDASVSVRLEFGRARLLFAGDLQQRDEAVLVSRGRPLESAVLKVPRHGSAAASSEAFVAAVRPRIAVISVGARNAQGLPREEVLERYRRVGAKVLRTDEDGAVIVETAGKELRYRAYRSGKRGTLIL